METRINKLLESEGISPTRFAERIGVQRSSISHILSGRNKPSYDFIVKILDSFPSLNPDWLLRGKGLMYKNDVPLQPGLFDSLNEVKNESEPKKSDISEAKEVLSHKSIDEIIPETSRQRSVSDKRIDKIVIFYNDNTFSDYKPG